MSEKYYVVWHGKKNGIYNSWTDCEKKVKIVKDDVKIPTVIVFISYWVIGFPISFYFGDINVLQEIGIWVGLMCGLLFSAVFLYLRFNYLINRRIQNA